MVDEPAWEQAEVIVLERERDQGRQYRAAAATEWLVTFDDENLYVAFRASTQSRQRSALGWRPDDTGGAARDMNFWRRIPSRAPQRTPPSPTLYLLDGNHSPGEVADALLAAGAAGRHAFDTTLASDV